MLEKTRQKNTYAPELFLAESKQMYSLTIGSGMYVRVFHCSHSASVWDLWWPLSVTASATSYSLPARTKFT
jgi:hypothetical protein